MLIQQAYRVRHRELYAIGAFGLALLVLFAISITSVWSRHGLNLAATREAPWCGPGEVPAFHFGFSALAQQIGNVMGVPIECEHGDESSDGTQQLTSTGLASYDWCTNTPEFSRNQDHWALTPTGLLEWTGDATPPNPLPIVRVPDLRELCPT